MGLSARASLLLHKCRENNTICMLSICFKRNNVYNLQTKQCV